MPPVNFIKTSLGQEASTVTSNVPMYLQYAPTVWSAFSFGLFRGVSISFRFSFLSTHRESMGPCRKLECERRVATMVTAPGKVIFRFHARDLHLVLGPGKAGKAVRFRVRIDGTPSAGDHGGDADEQGDGVVREYRLSQLVRQKGKVEDRTFEIEFLDPRVQAYAFTFG